MAGCQNLSDLIATTSDTGAATEVTGVSTEADTVVEVLAENSESHEDAEDYQYDSTSAVQIVLSGETISADKNGVSIAGNVATITRAGVYTLSGTLSDGQIVIETEDEGTVHLILNGITINSSTSAPLAILKAEKVVIELADGTQNTLTDAASYIYPDAETDEPNAALFSKADLTIFGNGSLTVNGNYNDGITSKDGLVITSGIITVNAVDDGIRGKDYLIIKDGTLTVNAGGDGLKSDNDTDVTLGYISVENGSLQITVGGDAISAETDVMIADGEFVLTSGGGSNARIADTASAKGIKAVVSLNIENGTFTIDSADDTLHSNGTLIVNGGTFTLSSGDDGMHADTALEINAGTIQITQSYEGIESAVITINGGNIWLVSSDDGINVASGNDGSGFGAGGGFGGPGGARPGGPGADFFDYTGNYYLYINGGYIVVDANGDGIDVNGAVQMTGGTVLVNGPTEQMNGPLDYDSGFNITGGLLVATGSAGMAQVPGESSSQNSLLVYFGTTIPSGTIVHIQNSAGEDVLTFVPTKNYQSLAFSSPDLAQGETYTIYVEGSSTGTAADGLIQDGAYTPGTEVGTFKVSSTVTQMGSGGGRR
ncbi:MAG: carbohydrate-binding domain-containing protein [Anaerolineales bacterium]|nr:carbohydrate-binding domain-containing protein [Anaerolineales bacterium]